MTVYPKCVLAVRKLRQQLTSSFTVAIIIVQGKPSFTRQIKYVEPSQDRVIQQLQRCCYSVTIN